VVNHPSLIAKIDEHSRKSCEEVVEEFFKKIKSIAYPFLWISGVLFSALVSVLIYFVSTSIEHIDQLTTGINNLKVTIASTQQFTDDYRKELDRTRDSLEKLKERVYKN
jgi:uncharacterized protein (DUF302 family)